MTGASDCGIFQLKRLENQVKKLSDVQQVLFRFKEGVGREPPREQGERGTQQ